MSEGTVVVLPTGSREDLDKLIELEIKKCQESSATAGGGGGARFTDCSATVQRIINSRKYRDIIVKAFPPPSLQVWDGEPHLRYDLIAGVPIPTIQVDPEDGDRFMKLALPSSETPEGEDAVSVPTTAYAKTPLCSRCLYSTVHIGQRKLLISEILFMTLHAAKTNTVVYIGAAGGSHIPALCEMYPDHRFLLYDPAQFSRPLMDYMRSHPDRVAVYNELFPPRDKDGKSARDLKMATSKGFILISDIRRKEENAEAPTNADVIADMDLQRDICREMQPLAAHLKCRLSYLNPEADPPEPDIEMKLPKGDIYFQPWCGPKSTETRLIIEPPYDDAPGSTMTLSSRWYESALFHHNLNGRYSRYVVPAIDTTNPFVGTIYDNCFDCTFERYTLWRYVSLASAATDRRQSYTSLADVLTLIKKIIGREDDRLLRGNEQQVLPRAAGGRQYYDRAGGGR